MYKVFYFQQNKILLLLVMSNEQDLTINVNSNLQQNYKYILLTCLDQVCAINCIAWPINRIISVDFGHPNLLNSIADNSPKKFSTGNVDNAL